MKTVRQAHHDGSASLTTSGSAVLTIYQAEGWMASVRLLFI
ncbi:MAG TPA: hypothetical protein VJ165_01840 [candidate division Zixibacteria bacterium]|nr:hypothetical protein [candidate division Zixibacteria bacterium]